mgnify:CR=1 FL=1
MLKSYIDYIFLLLVFLLILSTIIIKQTNKRYIYEQFLISEYKNIPNYSNAELKKISKPEHPDLASFQNYFMTIDPKLGYVPLERLKDAFIYTNSIDSRSRYIDWTNTESNMGGRTRCIVFDPNDQTNKKVWAGGITGGLWYNNDITSNDSNWQPVNDLWDNLVVSSIAFDPNNSQ